MVKCSRLHSFPVTRYAASLRSIRGDTKKKLKQICREEVYTLLNALPILIPFSGAAVIVPPPSVVSVVVPVPDLLLLRHSDCRLIHVQATNGFFRVCVRSVSDGGLRLPRAVRA